MCNMNLNQVHNWSVVNTHAKINSVATMRENKMLVWGKNQLLALSFLHNTDIIMSFFEGYISWNCIRRTENEQLIFNKAFFSDNDNLKEGRRCEEK